MVATVVQHHSRGPTNVLCRVMADGHDRGKRRVDFANAGFHHPAMLFPLFGNRQFHRDVTVFVSNRHRVKFQVRHNLKERVRTGNHHIIAACPQRLGNTLEMRRHPHGMHATRYQTPV